jgi:hypothetical protein
MHSCYIYQPQYLGAALSRTNGLPIGDAITGSVEGGAGVLRGDGDLARPGPPGSIHPSLPRCPEDCWNWLQQLWSVRIFFPSSPLSGWEESPRILSRKVTPASTLPPLLCSLLFSPFGFS